MSSVRPQFDSWRGLRAGMHVEEVEAILSRWESPPRKIERFASHEDGSLRLTVHANDDGDFCASLSFDLQDRLSEHIGLSWSGSYPLEEASIGIKVWMCHYNRPDSVKIGARSHPPTVQLRRWSGGVRASTSLTCEAKAPGSEPTWTMREDYDFTPRNELPSAPTPDEAWTRACSLLAAAAMTSEWAKYTLQALQRVEPYLYPNKVPLIDDGSLAALATEQQLRRRMEDARSAGRAWPTADGAFVLWRGESKALSVALHQLARCHDFDTTSLTAGHIADYGSAEQATALRHAILLEHPIAFPLLRSGLVWLETNGAEELQILPFHRAAGIDLQCEEVLQPDPAHSDKQVFSRLTLRHSESELAVGGSYLEPDEIRPYARGLLAALLACGITGVIPTGRCDLA